jgi:subtilisin-like proprotein convertase family protein
MNLQQHLIQLDELVVQGKFLEAIDRFFHSDVICYSTPNDAIYGNVAKRESIQNFFNQISAINNIVLHHQAIGNDVTMSEMTFEFTTKNGKQLIWNEVIRRTWLNGQVIEEKYYTCECNEHEREHTVAHPSSLFAIRYPQLTVVEETRPEIVVEPILEGNLFDSTRELGTIDHIEESFETNTFSASTPETIEQPQEEVPYTPTFASFIGDMPTVENTVEFSENAGFEVASSFADASAEIRVDTVPMPEEQDFISVGMTSEIETETVFDTPTFGSSFDTTTEALKEDAVETETVSVFAADRVILKGVAVNQMIPDDFNVPLISAMNFTNEGTVNKLGLNINIEHPFIQDLIVKLVAPSGKSVIVHNREGIVDNSIRNIQRAYGPEYFEVMKSEPIQGEWKLEVSDNSKRDVGRLNGWSLYLLPEEKEVIMADVSTTQNEMTTNAEEASAPISFSSTFTSFVDETSAATTEEETNIPVMETSSFSASGFMSFYNEPATQETSSLATEESASAFTEEQIVTTSAIIEEAITPNLVYAGTDATTNVLQEYTRLSGSNVLSQIVLVNEVIPDNYGALVSRMRFSTQRLVEQLDLEVDIDHPCISDLVISLIAPSGRSVLIHNREGGRTENLKRIYGTSFFESFSGESIAGDWKLEVFDKATTDVGKLNHWSLRILPGTEIIANVDENTTTTVANEILSSGIAASALEASIEAGVTTVQEAVTVEEAITIEIANEDSGAIMGSNVQIIEIQVNENIPDNQDTPLVSSVLLSNPSTVKDLGLFVDIEHPFCTDLQIILEAPSGKSAVVYDREGGFSNNMIHYFNSEFFPDLLNEAIQGEWRLKIYDFAPRDEGKLNVWRLYILPA